LVETVQHHLARGEKVLVFAAHTQTWNVIPRLQWVFDQAGLRATSMPRMKPEKRQAWCQSFDLSGTDVLIASVNELAEGVDLVAFTTVIFWEISYIVFKVAQAARRSLRVTQTRPVTVYYVNPVGTLASQALEIVLYEMLLDSLLCGELPSTDVMSRVANDHSSFIEKVARAAIEASGQVEDLAAVFARHNQATRAAHAAPARGDAYLYSLPAPPVLDTPGKASAAQASVIERPAPMTGTQMLLL
jgi:hypothetical protein